MITPIRIKIIEIAVSQIGTKESPPNSNLTKYGQWYGLNGQPWCSMFYSWCLNQAGYTWKVTEDKQGKGFSYVPTLYIRAKQNNWITFKPELADAVLFDWQGDKQADHIGFFLCWLVEGQTFLTIEGNTCAVGNQSDGGEVMLKERNIKDVLAFVKVSDL